MQQKYSTTMLIKTFSRCIFNAGWGNGGESLFLRKLVLGIPAQASGKNLTRPLLPSAPQPSCVRGTSPHHRKLGAGYVPLPQMTGRCFGKPFYFVSTYASAPIPTKQRTYTYWGLPAFAFALHGWQRLLLVCHYGA